MRLEIYKVLLRDKKRVCHTRPREDDRLCLPWHPLLSSPMGCSQSQALRSLCTLRVSVVPMTLSDLPVTCNSIHEKAFLHSNSQRKLCPIWDLTRIFFLEAADSVASKDFLRSSVASDRVSLEHNFCTTAQLKSPDLEVRWPRVECQLCCSPCCALEQAIFPFWACASSLARRRVVIYLAGLL